MTRSVRGLDWDATPVGPRGQWPMALATLVDLILAASQPMLIAWGPERTVFYNDAYAPILAAAHPDAFGQSLSDVWLCLGPIAGALADQALDGTATAAEEMMVTLDRGEGPVEAWFSHAFTPVMEEGGRVAGLFCVVNEITNEVTARQALEHGRAQRRQLLQEMPGFVAILAGPEHAVRYVNEAFVSLTGHRTPTGRSIREALPDVGGHRFLKILDDVFASGRRFSIRAAPIVFGAAAEARYIDLSVEAIRDDRGAITGVFVGGYDVSEAQQGVKALRQSDVLLAALVASSDDAIISKTIQGVVTSWNAGAERIFGYLAEELIGQPIARLAMPGNEAEMPNILERVRQGQRVEHFETERRHKDGSAVLVSLTVSPIHDEAGQVIGASKVARDITAVRRAADALKLAQARLQEQHRELLHAARLGELGQMAAALGHEINQPLSAIINYLHAAETLFQQDEPSERPMLAEAIQLAAGQAVRAAEVVRRLRGFAKQNDGAVQPESINQIVEETAAFAGIDVARRGVTVDYAFSPLQDRVVVDRIAIQQVLLNLIRNALERWMARPGAICCSPPRRRRTASSFRWRTPDPASPPRCAHACSSPS